jgi:hypothetical protein
MHLVLDSLGAINHGDMPQLPKTLVRFLDSVLMREAEAALQRVVAVPDPVSQAGAAFTAIVAAAGSVEAYLSELMAHLEEVGFIHSQERAELKKERFLWKK